MNAKATTKTLATKTAPKKTKVAKTQPATIEEASPKPELTSTLVVEGKSKSKSAAKPKRTSALDAAVRVLGETSQPMTTRELIEAMATKGYWTSPNGQTPAATLYAAILREIATKKGESRFVKTERGRFALAS